MRRRHPREDVDLARQRCQRGTVESGKLAGLGHSHLAVVGDPEVVGDRGGGLGLVARDEDGPDPCRAAGGDRFANAASDRIAERDQAEPDQLVVDGLGIAGKLAIGQPEHAHPARGERGIGGADCTLRVRRERLGTARVDPAGRASEDLLGRALDGDEPAIAVVMKRRHPVLTVTARANPEQREPATQRLVVEPGVAGRAKERAFGGATANLRSAVGQLRLVAQGTDGERAGQSRVVDGRRGAVLASGQMPVVDGHAVFGDRARLVRADDGRCPEALGRRQPADERALRRHPSNAQRERRRRDGRQAFGHGRDGKRDHRADHFGEGESPQQAERERAATERQRHSDEPAAQPVELAFERRRGRRRLSDEGPHAPDFGVTARRRDDGEGGALGDDGAREDHVGAVRESGGVIAHQIGPLGRGQAFPGQRRFVGGEPFGVDHASVGRNVVTGPQDEDVTDDERGCCDPDVGAFATNEGVGHRRALERHQDALHPALGDVTDRGVDGNDGEDHSGVDEGAAHERECGRYTEHEHRHRHHVTGDDLER